MVFETLITEPVVVAFPLDHPLASPQVTARRAAVALRDLHDQNLILVRRPGAPGLYANLLALVRCAGASGRTSWPRSSE